MFGRIALICLLAVGLCYAAGQVYNNDAILTLTADNTTTSFDSGYVSIMNGLWNYRSARVNVTITGPQVDSLGVAASDTAYVLLYQTLNDTTYLLDSQKLGLPLRYNFSRSTLLGDTGLYKGLVIKWKIADSITNASSAVYKYNFNSQVIVKE